MGRWALWCRRFSDWIRGQLFRLRRSSWSRFKRPKPVRVSNYRLKSAESTKLRTQTMSIIRKISRIPESKSILLEPRISRCSSLSVSRDPIPRQRILQIMSLRE